MQARDVLDLLQRCCSCISHKRDVALGGESDVGRIAVLGQRAVVPCCNSRFCNLDVVRPDKADVCHRCGHPVIVPFWYVGMRDHGQRCDGLHVHCDVCNLMYLQAKRM